MPVLIDTIEKRTRLNKQDVQREESNISCSYRGRRQIYPIRDTFTFDGIKSELNELKEQGYQDVIFILNSSNEDYEKVSMFLLISNLKFGHYKPDADDCIFVQSGTCPVA